MRKNVNIKSVEILKLQRVTLKCTGCSLNIVFFSEFLKIFWTLAFLCFPSVSVCVHTPGRQNTRVQKNHKILRKNTIFNEHHVHLRRFYCAVCQNLIIINKQNSITFMNGDILLKVYVIPFRKRNSTSSSKSSKRSNCTQQQPTSGSNSQLMLYT